MNKARGLQYFHLSGNPGITDRNIEFLRSRVRCQEHQEVINIDFTPIEQDTNEGKGPKDILEKNLALDE